MTKATATDVDVVLPCLDEAAALPWVLDRIPDGWRAVVVDNGSTDGSAAIARDLGATVVHEPRRGFGAACHAGLLAADAEFVCFLDCDASLDPGLLPGLVRLVAEGAADLVLGRRRPQARGAWPLHARVGNLALARMLRRRTGVALRDLGPMRAARREALLGLDLTDRRSGYPLQMVVEAADAGWCIEERDVPYLPRTGASKVTGTWRGTWHAVHDMRDVLRRPPRSDVGPAELPPTVGEAAGSGARVDVTLRPGGEHGVEDPVTADLANGGPGKGGSGTAGPGTAGPGIAGPGIAGPASAGRDCAHPAAGDLSTADLPAVGPDTDGGARGTPAPYRLPAAPERTRTR